jgi:hypothetical protein
MRDNGGALVAMMAAKLHAVLRGDKPSATLLEAEAKAEARLTEARENLHAAMARAMDRGS